MYDTHDADDTVTDQGKAPESYEIENRHTANDFAAPVQPAQVRTVRSDFWDDVTVGFW